jgi:hypothetical protein
MAAADERYVYICGGFSDDGDHIDVWRFDTVLEKWKMLSPDMVALDAPASRYCGACAWFGDRLFLFGGRSRRDPKRNFNDLWCFDLISRKWSCLGLNREPKQYDPKASFPGYHAKSASAKVGRYWYIWGGEGRHGHVSDLWRLNLETLDWELVQPARCDDPIFW